MVGSQVTDRPKITVQGSDSEEEEFDEPTQTPSPTGTKSGRSSAVVHGDGSARKDAPATAADVKPVASRPAAPVAGKPAAANRLDNATPPHPVRVQVSKLEPAATARLSAASPTSAISTASSFASFSSLADDFMRGVSPPVMSNDAGRTVMVTQLLSPSMLMEQLERVARGTAHFSMPSSAYCWERLLRASQVNGDTSKLALAYKRATHAIHDAAMELSSAAEAAQHAEKNLLQRAKEILGARSAALEAAAAQAEAAAIVRARRAWMAWSAFSKRVVALAKELGNGNGSGTDFMAHTPTLPPQLSTLITTLQLRSHALERVLQADPDSKADSAAFVPLLQAVLDYVNSLDAPLDQLLNKDPKALGDNASAHVPALKAQLDAANARVNELRAQRLEAAAAAVHTNPVPETDDALLQQAKAQAATEKAIRAATADAAAVHLLEFFRAQENVRALPRKLRLLRQKTLRLLDKLSTRQVVTTIARTALEVSVVNIPKRARARACEHVRESAITAAATVTESFTAFVCLKNKMEATVGSAPMINPRFAQALHECLQTYALADFTAALGSWVLHFCSDTTN